MTEEIRNTLTEEVKKLIAAPSACPEAKAACEKWLAAAGTADEEAATAILKKEVHADIMPIDGLIGFAGSDAGKALFGEERAAAIRAHAKGRSLLRLPGLQRLRRDHRYIEIMDQSKEKPSVALYPLPFVRKCCFPRIWFPLRKR